jgi:histidinol dehydrogenase
VKRSSVIAYTKEGLAKDAPAVQALAQAEGLWAHALSVGLRRKLVEGGVERFADAGEAVADAGVTAWPRALDEPGVPVLGGTGRGA